MGYSQRGEITDFSPDDTDKVMYIVSCTIFSMEELINRIKEKWPNTSMADIEISAEYIQTQCLYYDRYDSGDYTNYIVITNKSNN